MIVNDPPRNRTWISALTAVAVTIGSMLGSIGEAKAYAADDRDDIRRMVVAEALSSRNVPPSLAMAVAKVESNFNPTALSSAGARGVMQIMPNTGRGEFGVEPDRLWDARLNVQLGVRFLDSLIDRYGRWDLALSHYNGGTISDGRVKPVTRDYVNAVLAWQRKYARDETVVAMVNAAGGASAAPAGNGLRYAEVPAEYMLYDDPRVLRDWRHYLNVADYWLNKPWQREARQLAAQSGSSPSVPVEPSAGATVASADTAAAAPQPGDATVAGTVGNGVAASAAAPEPYWPTVGYAEDRPSDRLRRSIEQSRSRFREHLVSGTPRWSRAYGG